MATRQRGGLVAAVRVDLVRLHETWMELLFPRQRDPEHSVLGKWQPTTTSGRVAYRLWGAVGVPVVGVLYPLLLLGFATRFYSRRFDSVETRLGLGGVVLLAVVVWGALTVLARFQFSTEGFLAVAAASAVAVVSAGLAVVFSRVGGRATTVLIAYPFAMTAIFLPPVVAAVFGLDPAGVLPSTKDLARTVRDALPAAISDPITDRFDFTNVTLVLIWVLISVPLGWLLGAVVTLADLVRPADDEDETGAAGE